MAKIIQAGRGLGVQHLPDADRMVAGRVWPGGHGLARSAEATTSALSAICTSQWSTRSKRRHRNPPTSRRRSQRIDEWWRLGGSGGEWTAADLSGQPHATRGAGVLIKQALGQGTLPARHAGPMPAFSGADHRSRDSLFQPAALAELDARLTPIRVRFGDTPSVMARVALQYALQRDPNATALVGFRNVEQLQTIVTSLTDPLASEEITELRALLHPITITA